MKQAIWRPASSLVSALPRPRVAIAQTTRTSRYITTVSHTPKSHAKHVVLGSTLLVVISLGYTYITDTRAAFHRYVVPPILRALYPDAEDAHHATIGTLKELHSLGLHPRDRAAEEDIYGVEVFGHQLSNPIGISGGLDKNALVPDALFALGPSIVEIGGVTAKPQEGNPRPRVFRVPSEEAVINRYGLNSDGVDIVAGRLRHRVREYAYSQGFGFSEAAERAVLNGRAGVPPGSLSKGKLLAVQVAKNKATTDTDLDAVVNDHVYCVEKIGKYADIIVVNVSSPNTPGLRSLQSRDPLTRILSAVVHAATNLEREHRPAVMVKVSPDEDSPSQIRGICEAVWKAGVDGVIVGNTTMLRPEPLLNGIGIPASEAAVLREQGGFSGPQLFERTVHLIGAYRRVLDQGPNYDESTFDQKPVSVDSWTPKIIFASGGITSGSQALDALDAGASIAMVYTTLLYNGAGTIRRIKNELSDEWRRRQK